MIALIVAKNEFIRGLKNKKKMIMTFFVPLIAIFAALCINYIMKPSINIGIVENNYRNAAFEEKLKSVDGINAAIADKKSINTSMICGKYLAVIDFKNDKQFTVYCLDEKMKKIIEQAATEINTSGTSNIVKAIRVDLDKDRISASQRGVGFIFMTLIITCILSASNMLNDKKDKVLMRYTVSSNKYSSYILGNYIYNILYSLMQVIVVSVILYLFKVDIGISIMQFIIVASIVAVTASSMSSFFVVISKNELQAGILGSSSALIISLLGGAFMPISKMPDTLKFISNISITKWFMRIVELMEKGGSYFAILGVLLLIAVIMQSLAVVIGRKRLFSIQ